MKKNDLVTVKDWYMKRRTYGRIIGSNQRKVFVLGKFGLGEFHRSSVRVVKTSRLKG